MKCWIFLILGLWLSGSVGAQEIPFMSSQAPPMTPDQQRQFEDTHLISSQVGVFDIRYELNGKEINGEKELENIIATQKDEISLQELKNSQKDQSLGWMLMGGGSGMVVAGGVLIWNKDGNTLSQVFILGGLAVDVLGGLIFRQSRVEQLDAVDRYNQLVRQENGISFGPLSPSSGMTLSFVHPF